MSKENKFHFKTHFLRDNAQNKKIMNIQAKDIQIHKHIAQVLLEISKSIN